MYFKMKTTSKEVADISIDGEIVSDSWLESDTSASDFRDSLKSLGDVKTINLSINSPGGSVFDGIAIYNMLKSNPAQVNVIVQGLAGSIASVIAMAGDKLIMNSGSMLMIHNPFTMTMGNAKEMRAMADTLDQIAESSVDIYNSKTGLDKDTIRSVMDAETWLTADEAIEAGWADEKADTPAVMQSVSERMKQMWQHAPEMKVSDDDTDDKDKKKKSDDNDSESESEDEKSRNNKKQAAIDYAAYIKEYLKELG